ncbi:hypothetical protein EXIGLDRAFT_701855 [Exidia glandulosa HHB12029]|uniref:Novel STAND NTPase 1 domain-containing protein n=1 Tax=Exidia glandulosa HHB12029 TaxID=1314781 RepID=A0A165CU28_EXIGL|nr:hypothetical protein EXIGLDRAFT_701855 [Exidia glandulosa HHB12029]
MAQRSVRQHPPHVGQDVDLIQPVEHESKHTPAGAPLTTTSQRRLSFLAWYEQFIAPIPDGFLDTAISGPYLGIGGLVVEDLRNVSANKDGGVSLAHHLSGYVDAVAEASEAHDEDSEMAHACEEFMGYGLVNHVQEHLDAQKRRSFFARLINQRRDADALKDLSERLRTAFAIFRMRANLQVKNAIERSNLDSSALRENAANAASWLDSTVTLPGPIIGLPPLPQLFFGRTPELELVVSSLTAPGNMSARIAVLGGPGIGKTTLTVAALHHTSVATRFPVKRYFVSCDAAEGQSASCLHLVASAFGIVDDSVATMKRKLATILNHDVPPSLLVLDNFESVWEALDRRTEAEDLLQFLASMQGLSLVVTMRGSERPQGVKWTPPCLPPLSPLDDAAAVQTFVAISDVNDDDPGLSTLLGYLGNVPLALTLAANLAQYEGTGSLIARWQQARTTVVARCGQTHRLTSLDVSIALSVESPRVKNGSGAQTLLSLLALLPAGVVDSDIELWELDAWRSVLATLLRTSLAVRSRSGRVHVSAPIRGYMQAYFTPTPRAMEQLYAHYFQLARFIGEQSSVMLVSLSDTIAIASVEVDNIASVVSFALAHSDDLLPAIEAATNLARFYDTTHIGSRDLLSEALVLSRSASLDKQTAEILALMGRRRLWTDPTSASALLQEATALFLRVGYAPGLVDATAFLTQLEPNAAEAILSCEAVLSLALSHNDNRSAGIAHTALGRAYRRSKRADKAYEHFEEALVYARKLGSQGHVMTWTLTLVTSLKDSRVWTKQVLSPNLVTISAILAIAHQVHGDVLRVQGHPTTALEHLNTALTLFRASHEVTEQVHCFALHMSASLASGDAVSALQALNLAKRLPLEGSTNPSLHKILLLHMQAEVELSQGDAIAARDICALAATACSGGLYVYRAKVLFTAGLAEHAIGDVETARIHFLVSCLINRTRGQNTLAVVSLNAFARMLDDDDEGADHILRAIMLPLLRFGFSHDLAEALLHRAWIAMRQGQLDVARHRALNALSRFKASDDKSGSERAEILLTYLLGHA